VYLQPLFLLFKVLKGKKIKDHKFEGQTPSQEKGNLANDPRVFPSEIFGPSIIDFVGC